MDRPDGQLRPSYLRFSDELEIQQPDEGELIDMIVDSMMRVGCMVFDKRRHAVRNAHAKSHGFLVGTLTVHDHLPPHLRQGLFAVPASYPVVLRFSSAPGDILSDAHPAPKGMAIKVIGVPGRKVLPGREDELTQDFLLVNHPVLPFGTVAAYWKMEQQRERHADDPEVLQRAAAAFARGATRVMNLTGLDSALLANRSMANHHILGETFHSMAAMRFGDYVAKISAAPSSADVRALTGRPYDPQHAPSVLRDQIAAFFRSNAATYELRAQLCTDAGRMPIEDASVPWDEERSPHQPVATISLPFQDSYSPARRVYGDEVLSFNPWHCIPEHRPLGSIMRARRKAYEASASFRHAMNLQPRTEPRNIADVPA